MALRSASEAEKRFTCRPHFLIISSAFFVDYSMKDGLQQRTLDTEHCQRQVPKESDSESRFSTQSAQYCAAHPTDHTICG